MEATKKKMKKEENHKHQDIIIEQRKKVELGKSQGALEAQLKTQEYKEMLKRLK